MVEKGPLRIDQALLPWLRGTMRRIDQALLPCVRDTVAHSPGSSHGGKRHVAHRPASPPMVGERHAAQTALPTMVGRGTCSTYTLPTMVGREDMQHIQPPWDRGWEREDTPYIPPWYLWWPYYPAYMTWYTSLGGPQHAHGRTGWSAPQRSTDGRTVTGRGAQEGDLPWVRASRVPPGHKGVNVGRRVCAETSALSPMKECNDRIAYGTIPMYGP